MRKKIEKKKRYVTKRQAVSGNKIKKRNVGKVKNQISDVAKYLWKPKSLSGLAVFLLMIIAYENINLNKMLPIESVKIEGEFEYLNKIQLKDQALPVVKGGFFNVNLPAVRNALITLPWVENVSVRRQWPNELLVRVIEKKPVVLWGEEGFISARGELFIPDKKPLIDLPMLSGPKGQHKVMLKELARMQAWLIETDLRIKNIELNERRSWTLVMTSGMELRLGREDMHERLNRFVSVYSDTLEKQKLKIKHIDMRYTNGFAVAWEEA